MERVPTEGGSKMATFSLDRSTIQALEGIVAVQGYSKAETLRRLIKAEARKVAREVAREAVQVEAQ